MATEAAGLACFRNPDVTGGLGANSDEGCADLNSSPSGRDAGAPEDDADDEKEGPAAPSRRRPEGRKAAHFGPRASAHWEAVRAAATRAIARCMPLAAAPP